jgi:NTE family protein
MKRALVLGGGGPIGVGWETGLVQGLMETGFAPDTLDAIVGTSAGAIVGAQLAHGQLAVPRGGGQGDPAASLAKLRSNMDRSKLDPQAITQIFTIWAGIQHTTTEQAAAIGKLVRGLDRSGAPAWIEEIKRLVSVSHWPKTRLLVCSVDAETGERRVFDSNDDVPLERAIAASSSVPGLFPAVEIRGRVYMDGQVQSSTNADVLVPHRPAQVLIAMPTNPGTSRGLGGHSQRMVEREIAALRAAGSKVFFKTPSSEDVQRMGPNLMDYDRVRDAFEVGVASGRAWAAELG